jgi:hypothetical protein
MIELFRKAKRMKDSPLALSSLSVALAMAGCGGKSDLRLYEDMAGIGGSSGRGGAGNGAEAGARAGMSSGGSGAFASGGVATGGAAGQGAAGNAGSAGNAGNGGAAGSECVSVRVGHAFFSASAPDLAYVMLQSWIDDEYNIAEIDLHDPLPGSFDLGTPDNQNTATCSECVTVKHAQGGVWDRTFMAQAGLLQVATVSHVDGYSSGRLAGVTLREVVVDAMTGVSTLIPDGACLVVDDTEWQTAQCQVGSLCPASMECLGTYYSTNGSCVPRGSGLEGDACSAELPTTDCQAGLDCAYGYCRPTCNYWSLADSCPSPFLCNADSRCINGADPAPIGSPCTQPVTAYCGPESGRYAGQCIDRDGVATCGRLCRNDADCATSCEPLYENASYGTCAP